MTTSRAVSSTLLLCCSLLVACAGPAEDTASVPAPAATPSIAITATAVPAPTPIAAAAPTPPWKPIASLGRPGESGSSIALGRLGGRRLGFVADEDDRALHTVDIDTRTDLAVTPLGEVPSQLVIGSDGLIYAGLRSAAAIQILASTGAPEEPLRAIARLPVAAEPVGLALTHDGATLLVTTGISHTLSGIALADRRVLFTVALPREPRSIAVPGEGTHAFIVHAAGSVVSVVDLKSTDHPQEGLALTARMEPYRGFCLPRGVTPPRSIVRTMPGVQGFGIAEVNGTLYVPQVNARPRSTMQASTSTGYGPDEGVSEISRIVAIDPKKRRLHEGSLEIPGVEGGSCLLPRAAAKNPVRGSLLVACLGDNKVTEAAVRGDSASYEGSFRQWWDVPAGPTGIAFDEAGQNAVVFSQIDRAVSILDLGKKSWSAPPPATTIPLRPLVVPLDPVWSRGRELFLASGDRRISRDGRACASCHPDGRDDGIAWSTPHGARQTPMLAGRLADTAPYGWEGQRASLSAHVATTIIERLHGNGLPNDDLEALAAYVLALPAPPRAPRPLTPRELHGAELFRSGEVGCAGCHQGAMTADGLGHDIQSGGRFDTPSLRFVAGTGPYFHDGRYPSLHAMLIDMDGRMGHVGQLEEKELDALEAYLETL